MWKTNNYLNDPKWRKEGWHYLSVKKLRALLRRITLKHAKDITDFEKKKILTLTNKELKSHEVAAKCYIFRKIFTKKFAKDKNHQKIRDYCHYTHKYRGATHNICNVRFNVPNEIPVVFHNDSNYDYHFIIKELAKQFKGQFECLGENTENYKTFSVPI